MEEKAAQTDQEFIDAFVEHAVRRAIDEEGLFPFPLWHRDKDGASTCEAIADDTGTASLFKGRFRAAKSSQIAIGALDMFTKPDQDAEFSDLVLLVIFRDGEIAFKVMDYDNKVDPPVIREPRESKFWSEYSARLFK